MNAQSQITAQNSPISAMFSSILGRTGYIGFLVDWSIGATSVWVCFMAMTVAASVYIGIFLYINALVADLKQRVQAIDVFSSSKPRQPMDHLKTWSIYLQEIELHIEIIGYMLEIYLSLT